MIKSVLNLTIFAFVAFSKAEYKVSKYIFPLPRNAFPREGTGVKTVFFPREIFTFRGRREEGRLSN